MDDIRPPRQPQRPLRPLPATQPPLETVTVPAIATKVRTSPPSEPRPPKKKVGKIVAVVLASLALLAGTLALAGYVWYQTALSAVDARQLDKIPITITSGSTPSAIASQLYEKGLVRNTTAFMVYTRITDTQNRLQAGSYRLSPSESTPEIVGHLTKGAVDTIDITFLPGATLAENRDVFMKAGYTTDQIDKAFAEQPDRPLFDGAPEDADLEGYIFGETYRVSAAASVQDILDVTFDQFEKVIEENDLRTGFAAQGLSLFEGITLASIIQRESIGGDEPQIAQVFLSRIEIGMMLGSDVTYQYIADKTGVPRDTNLDSPYNTRRYPGLPPGPIAAPGVASLRAVANPAEGDFLFFLSGDDDVTYFGRTVEEHEANIRNHCQVKCLII
jgi:UPF0755 protein